MGSLYKKTDKKNTWVFQYTVNGERKSKTLSNIPNLDRKQKRDLLNQYEKIYEGSFNHYGKTLPSIKNIMDHIIEERTQMVSLQTLSQNTLNGDISRFKYFWNFLKDNYKQKDLIVSDFDEVMLKKYMEYCRDIRGNNSTTIHNNIQVLRNISKVLIEKSYITENPFHKIKIPKPRKRSKTDIPLENDYNMIKGYLDHWVDGYLNSKNDFELINTFVYIQTKTGMRGGEVKLMKWTQGKNDFGDDHSYSYVYLDSEIKNIIIHFKRRTRVVPVHPVLRELLKKVKKDTESKIFVLEGHNNTTKSCIKKYIGKKLDDTYGRVRGGKGRVTPIVKLWEKVGLEKYYSPHDIRHGFISDCVRKDVSFKKIGDLVGHSHSRITEIYSHLRSQDLVDIIMKV